MARCSPPPFQMWRLLRRGNPPLTVCRRTPPRQHVHPWLLKPDTTVDSRPELSGDKWHEALEWLVDWSCLDDGNHARAAGNKVRDRGSRLWSPRGLRVNHPPTPSKLSVGELLLLLLLRLISSSNASWWSENACVACFVLVLQGKRGGFWESNLFIIHHRAALS